jgi:hypothetical protein
MDLIKTLRKKKADVNNLDVYTTVYGWCFVKVITDDRIYIGIPQEYDDEYHSSFMVNHEGKVIKDNDNNTHKDSICVVFPDNNPNSLSNPEKAWENFDRKGDSFEVGSYYTGYSCGKNVVLRITGEEDVFIKSVDVYTGQEVKLPIGEMKENYKQIEHFDYTLLQLFDRILAYDNIYEKWVLDFFGGIDLNRKKVYGVGGVEYDVFVPYNTETGYLLFTDFDAPEFYLNEIDYHDLPESICR